MLKGVNKQILEINNTESEYFEKVLFFVKPEYSNMDDSKLSFEAHMYSKGDGQPPKLKRKKIEKVIQYVKMAMSGVFGAILMALIMNNVG